MRNSAKATLRALMRQPAAIIGVVFIGVWTLTAILAPLIAPYDPLAVTESRLLPPSAEHLFGTDAYGRDVLSRVIYGGRLTLLSSLGAVAISLVFGVLLGSIAGYSRGFLRDLILRVLDVMFAIPQLILAMAISVALGAGLLSGMVAVAVVGIPDFARLTYSQVLSLKTREYIEASYTLGRTPPQIIAGHILPNAAGPLLVKITLALGVAALTTSALSFIGLGAQPPAPEWGVLIAEGRGFLITGQPWLTLFPGIAIATTILGFNLLGDALRDALDPKMQSR